MEKVAHHQVAGRELEREEWGEKPTVKFFKQAVGNQRTGGITELHPHRLGDDGNVHVDTDERKIDRPGGNGGLLVGREPT
eukprot:COSAG06_NODE_8750_length_2079_cov_2.363636_1_plen_80_part_00